MKKLTIVVFGLLLGAFVFAHGTKDAIPADGRPTIRLLTDAKGFDD